jgi:cytochrome c-type biogenesis protein CcmE
VTRKQRRLSFLIVGLAVLSVAVALTLSALQDTVTFFYSPTELETKHVPEGRNVRVGGLVEQGSVSRAAGEVKFRVTDTAKTVDVVYRGQLPDLFREGQGVVCEGMIGSDGVFRASEVLAKHDETYMPREVVDALKKSGRWQEGEMKK